jgi:hypothetical protein
LQSTEPRVAEIDEVAEDFHMACRETEYTATITTIAIMVVNVNDLLVQKRCAVDSLPLRAACAVGSTAMIGGLAAGERPLSREQDKGKGLSFESGLTNSVCIPAPMARAGAEQLATRDRNVLQFRRS